MKYNGKFVCGIKYLGARELNPFVLKKEGKMGSKKK
jgi:hypothetical protein